MCCSCRVGVGRWWLRCCMHAIVVSGIDEWIPWMAHTHAALQHFVWRAKEDKNKDETRLKWKTAHWCRKVIYTLLGTYNFRFVSAAEKSAKCLFVLAMPTAYRTQAEIWNLWRTVLLQIITTVFRSAYYLPTLFIIYDWFQQHRLNHDSDILFNVYKKERDTLSLRSYWDRLGG